MERKGVSVALLISVHVPRLPDSAGAKCRKRLMKEIKEVLFKWHVLLSQILRWTVSASAAH
jgi:hypothetical protein